MGLLIDIIIIAIILLNIIIGYKKGLINVIFSICAFLVAIIITVLLHEGIEKRFKIHFKRLFKE